MNGGSDLTQGNFGRRQASMSAMRIFKEDFKVFEDRIRMLSRYNAPLFILRNNMRVLEARAATMAALVGLYRDRASNAHEAPNNSCRLLNSVADAIRRFKNIMRDFFPDEEPQFHLYLAE